MKDGTVRLFERDFDGHGRFGNPNLLAKGAVRQDGGTKPGI